MAVVLGRQRQENCCEFQATIRVQNETLSQRRRRWMGGRERKKGREGEGRRRKVKEWKGRRDAVGPDLQLKYQLILEVDSSVTKCEGNRILHLKQDHYIAQANLELIIFLPQLPKCCYVIISVCFLYFSVVPAVKTNQIFQESNRNRCSLSPQLYDQAEKDVRLLESKTLL